MDAPKDYIDFIGSVKERIRNAQYTALKAVNKELVELYWDIGRMISEKQAELGWGKGVVGSLAQDIQKEFPGVKGFSSQNLWRMKQFFDYYSKREKLSQLVRGISWSNNLTILAQAKSDEETEFYLKLAIKERYSQRELQRQFNSGLFERTMLSQENLSPALRDSYPSINEHFRDFYLGALDNNIKKPHENPSIGMILCRSKDKNIVEISLNRTTSPAIVSQYATKLIDKELLRRKLSEIFKNELK